MNLSSEFVQNYSCTTLALFLDVDGTLLEFADTPDQVVVDDDLKQLLQSLNKVLGGSLALISGRSVADLDHLFGLPCLAAAGLHGMEWRNGAGQLELGNVNAKKFAHVVTQFNDYAAQNPGIIVENKTRTLALHYRANPTLKQDVVALARDCIATMDDFHLIEGNCVVELKPRTVNKGLAIEKYMQERPYFGRNPLFFGDDVTDEDGFYRVSKLGGVGVKVGKGTSLAPYRIASPEKVKAWLWHLLEHIS